MVLALSWCATSHKILVSDRFTAIEAQLNIEGLKGYESDDFGKRSKQQPFAGSLSED